MIGHSHSIGAAVSQMSPQNEIHLNCLMCILSPPFGFVIYGANWVVLCCGLNPASRCVVSWAPLEVFSFRPKLAAICDLLRATW